MSKEIIDTHLIRILHTLLEEGSVSRTASLLGQTQPAISVALRRLRELTGDPLLVRSGSHMVPTARGLALMAPAAQVLSAVDEILHPPLSFDPKLATHTFRIASPDYLDVFFVPAIVERFHRAAPNARLEFTHLLAGGGYERGLESGQVDLAIGNWQTPPDHLHLQPLCDDTLVCLVRESHPIKAGKLDQEAYVQAGHLAVTTHSGTGPGTIDIALQKAGLRRKVVTTLPYFCIAPYVLVKSDLIFTTTLSFAHHYAELLPLRVESLPIAAQPLRYYQLWHERTHRALESQWLRALVAEAARQSMREAA
ncbi:LysR family transcriptional regulator [Duganella sp. BJB476]|uniref:LysR family transcriptional regulator n=1 Tax=Duganella sp. BJB476 TaxID=1871176 RepID=UPI000E34AB09|nr:LysR family transcriptional regulator [Duganella sp. BJB476]RFP36174.1 LysR family transcriptional regulator [Duganella sp. BJB476]